MSGEPVLADIDPVNETAFDHVPAKPALDATEDEQTQEARQQRARDIARDAEADEGQKEDDADEAAEKAMRPFPPIDGLEPVSYTHLRAHETDSYLVCRLLLEKK